MKRALWLGCLLMMLALCAGGLAEETLPLRYGSTGDAVIMPAGIPHSLRATTRFKMMLTMIKG